jgi:hypothetical protein
LSSPKHELTNIKAFIESLSIDPSAADFSTGDARRIYRRFHALLIWGLVIDAEGEVSTVRLYFKEALSDLSTAYFLSFIGAYKAARLSTRGAIENIVRVLVADSGEDVLALNTIPGLITAAQSSWTKDSTYRAGIINNLYIIYGDLCNTVHAVSIDYMSLRIPFERVLEQDKGSFAGNADMLDDLFRLSGEALYLTFHQKLDRVGFRNADLVRDSVSASIKRAANES